MKPDGVPAALAAALPRAPYATWSPLSGLGRGSWLVQRSDGPDLVVRQASAVEENATRAAADVEAGPIVVAGAEGWLVTEYLPGVHVTGLELSRPARLDELAALLRRLHSSDLTVPAAPLADSRRAYLDAIGTEQLPDGLRAAAREADQIEEQLDSGSSPRVPAHLDVVANLLATPLGLRLIDFEYASAADPAREVGQVIWEAELDRAGAQRLVHSYGWEGDITVGRAIAWAWITGVTWTAWGLSSADSAILNRYGRRSWERVRGYWGGPDA